jgi:hypothetical protein
MNSTGSFCRIAASKRPFASYGFDGATTLRPGVWMNSASGDCE